METLSNAVVLAYHGCDKDVAEKILSQNNEHLKPSKNDYDWLGSGIYFWEADPVRGWEWAKEHHGEKDAAVVGAAIHLGRCLNLMSRRDILALAEAYGVLKKWFETAEAPLPTNGKSGMARKLDKAVIETLHKIREQADPPQSPYDTVRGLFIEGEPAYPQSGFYCKTHIQICVRETRVIKGYFRVSDAFLPRR